MKSTKAMWEAFEEILTYKLTESVDRYIAKFGINCTDNDGSTLLHVMVIYGTPELVRHTIKRGANLNVIDSNGNTPLSLACTSHFVENAFTLLDAGAKVNLGRGKYPIIQAIHAYDKTRSTALIEALLKHGASLSLKSGLTGVTAPGYAKHWNFEKVIQLFDLHTADLERQKLSSVMTHKMEAETSCRRMKI